MDLQNVKFHCHRTLLKTFSIYPRQGLHRTDGLQITRELISIIYILSPGHAGVFGNERADALVGAVAVQGALILDPSAFCWLC